MEQFPDVKLLSTLQTSTNVAYGAEMLAPVMGSHTLAQDFIEESKWSWGECVGGLNTNAAADQWREMGV